MSSFPTNCRPEPRRHSPRFDVLEQRLAPATQILEGGGLLTIRGDNRAEAVVIVDSGTATASNIVVLGKGTSFRSAGVIREIRVDTRGGKDIVVYRLHGDLAAGEVRNLVVNLGSGNDTFVGAGGGVGVNGRLSLVVAGQANNDRISYSASGAVSAGAALAVVARGDAGDDIITLNYIGQINGALDLTALGGGGRNRITRNITPLPGSTFGAAPGGPSTGITNPPGGDGDTTNNVVNIDLNRVDLAEFIDSVTNLLDRTQVDQVVLELKNLLSDLDLTEVVERIDELLVNQEATLKEILIDLLDSSSDLLDLEIPETLNDVLAGSIGDILRNVLGNVPDLNLTQLVGGLVGGDLATDLLDGVLNGNPFDDGLLSELIRGLLGGDTLLDVHAILDGIPETIGVEDLLGRIVGGDTLLDRLTDLEIADLLGRLDHGLVGDLLDGVLGRHGGLLSHLLGGLL